MFGPEVFPIPHLPSRSDGVPMAISDPTHLLGEGEQGPVKESDPGLQLGECLGTGSKHGGPTWSLSAPDGAEHVMHDGLHAAAEAHFHGHGRLSASNAISSQQQFLTLVSMELLTRTRVSSHSKEGLATSNKGGQLLLKLRSW